MAKGQKQYTEEFKNTIVELYNTGKSLSELSSEYALSKSTITGWINKKKPIAVDNSRKIIAYALSRTIDTTLALQAVKNAIKLQKPTKELILHSDLGCQYTSSVFKKYIDSTKVIKHSFSGKGCPYDNACIESFHASLKKEEVHLVNYFDYDTARLAIFEYIECWYNIKRIHGSIGHISPQKCKDLARKIA